MMLAPIRLRAPYRRTRRRFSAKTLCKSKLRAVTAKTAADSEGYSNCLQPSCIGKFVFEAADGVTRETFAALHFAKPIARASPLRAPRVPTNFENNYS
jgi:hypothetical protein